MSRPKPKPVTLAPLPQPDHYELLGIARNASIEDIKAAYVDKAKGYHPDVNPRGAELMKLFNQAYLALKDTTLRAAYDRKIGVRAAVPAFGIAEKVR